MSSEAVGLSIDEVITAIKTIERADQVILLAFVDVVRADKAQSVAEPGDGFVELRRVEHAMADTLHMRRPLRQPHHHAGARGRLRA